MTRRLLLLSSLASLAACSVLPDRPYQEVRRYALAPEPPARRTPPAGAPVLLLRSMRAAPGLDARGLRSVSASGVVTTEFWDEWTAPPADAAEEALRRWLLASGRFSAVTAPGSRMPADLVLEAELTRLEARPAEGKARAALSVLLLTESSGTPRVLGQMLCDGEGPLAEARPAALAQAMQAALADCLRVLDGELSRHLPQRRR